MIGILIISHGSLSAELIRASQMIVGAQQKVASISINKNEGAEALRDRVYDTAKSFGDIEGIIMFVDILGGTPCNVGAKIAFMDSLYEVITGVNLPMVLTALTYRKSCSLTELANKVVEEGIKSIGCPCRKINK